MNKNFFALTLLATAFALPALADEVQMPPAAAPSAAVMPASLPKRGASMAEVAKQFGEPQTKHPAVGGSSPKRPPITRWDYTNFSVFFANSYVVDTVVPGNPPAVSHADQLKSGTR